MGGVQNRRRALSGALAIAAGLVFGAPVSAPAQESPRVLMVDNEPDLTRWHYEPGNVTVPAGTTVVWFNKGKEEHSVTADDKSFDSGLKKTGATFARAFPQPGRYSYFCQPHPWMKGAVQVVAAAPSATSAAAPTPTTAAPTPTTVAAPPTPAPTESAPRSAAGGETAPAEGAAEGPQATTAPSEESSATDEGSDDDTAALASDGDGSGGDLAGTLAVVLLPTLGALALGARLRQARS